MNINELLNKLNEILDNKLDASQFGRSQTSYSGNNNMRAAILDKALGKYKNKVTTKENQDGTWTIVIDGKKTTGKFKDIVEKVIEFVEDNK